MLPKIETPKLDLELPVTGKKIKFRPFLVKEQKVLLQALEMGDDEQLNNAIEDIARSCTFGEINIDELPLADVEFLILNLRAKSVGESVELSFKCNECGVKNPVDLQLSTVTVVKEQMDEKIMINDDVGVLMKIATYKDIKEASEEKMDIDKGYKLILASIDKVFDKNQIYSRNDFTEVDLYEFLESLPTEAFNKIEDYVGNQPQLKKDINIKCISCGAESEVKLEGLSDFLG
jgi:hypothetical protein